MQKKQQQGQDTLDRIKQLLQTHTTEESSYEGIHHADMETASKLALLLLDLATQLRTEKEKQREQLLSRLIHDENLKAFTTSAIDSCFRTQDATRAIKQLLYLAKRHQIFLSLKWYEKPLYVIASMALRILPEKAFKKAKELLFSLTEGVILPAEQEALMTHIIKRKKEGIRVNVNRLGEAILGEQEAEKRLSLILLDLQNPLIDVVSVKISSIFSQINTLSYEATLKTIKKKLAILYTACKNFRTLDKKPKFLYLDMEEYKDLQLTVQAFIETLSAPEFYSLSAGIALQSYLPDSYNALVRISEWAETRVLQGGGTIKVRLVKGANLGMERVEASLKGWPQAPYKTKAEVDANFKKMLHYALDHTPSLHIAIASHNLFDISYAILLREKRKLHQCVDFEMLEGMCPHVTRAVHAVTKSMLLYCPAVLREEFHTAMAYLVRRLDENTQKENFLTHLFDLESEPLSYMDQKSRFERSVLEYATLDTSPRRTQDRTAPFSETVYLPFANAADTDWSLVQNRRFAENALLRWKNRTYDIPCVIGSGIIFTKERAAGQDPSRPGFPLVNFSLASKHDIDHAVRYAKENRASWNHLPAHERAGCFRRLATLLREHRGELICSIVAEAGKIFQEGDAEVSEAIDFADYYASVIEEKEELFRLLPKRETVSCVVSPWNFPLSIPTSSIIAPLAAGHAVIFKPSLEAAVTGFKLVELFYQAGIPREALQYITCLDEPVGSYLIKHPDIKLVIATGATETARHFLKMKPSLRLAAETGGKNCAIVTKIADRDLAVKEIVQSAFGYAGQKCSALSLLILDEEVYRDKKFMEQLLDATKSLPCGSAWDLSTKVNPLIRPPSGKLLQAITTLEPGEQWLLQPQINKENPCLVTPGIKMNVRRGSFTHKTELFGPVLGIMAAKNLDDACRIVNQTPYGLTSGLFSLDPREHAYWLEKVHAGNYYINRTITGAIVRRQPFGGCKASSFGTGMKAGGKNYLLQFLDSYASDFVDNPEIIRQMNQKFHHSLWLLKHDEERGRFIHAVSSYWFWKQNHFDKMKDTDCLVGEDNTLFYQPHDHLFFYVHETDDLSDCLLILAACTITGVKVTVGGRKQGIATISDERFLFLMQKDAFPRVRCLSKPNDTLLGRFAERAFSIDIVKPKAHGRLELLHFYHELSVSTSYHRYGNLLNREHEERSPTL